MSGNHPHLHRPSKGYVFIVTYGRSGSTVLQNLLNSIDGYCVRGENNNASAYLADAWYSINSSKPISNLRKAGVRSKQTHPWFGAELIDSDRVGQALADVLIKDLIQPPPNCRVAGFKEIRFHYRHESFSRHLDFLNRFFPNCRFIFNTRDHERVIKSGWWARREPETVRQFLIQAERLNDEYLSTHPDRGIMLHFDDYIRNPEALESLFEFLDEPFDIELTRRVMSDKLDHLKK
jgi:hypothetical protein